MNRAPETPPDQGDRGRPQPPRGLRFQLGVGMIVASFGVYVFYAAIAALPISRAAMSAAFLSLWGFSWALFAFGAFLAGEDGYEFVKERWRRLRGG